MQVIHAENIRKNFGDFAALDNINIDIGSGDFFGLFGPNGAGKTTILRIMTGQIEPGSGEASVLGTDVKNSVEVKKKIGVVPEYESPPSFLTTEEFLSFVCSIRNIDSKNIEYWLSFFDLSKKKKTLCKDLSKGMRQKLMLASAFIHKPEILFLDEPFINLDPIYQKKVREYLIDYVKNGNTIFLCSHILEIAEKLCNRIAIINNGKIAGNGTLDELRKRKDESLEEIFCRLVEDV
ncbi:MAG: ABC transporter ATP-binding protein [Candidatus Thermoplasmatota archaeon]|nr:ABC transporter ATP-binding protein [Candidatus Thermoplasmatota archaeon]